MLRALIARWADRGQWKERGAAALVLALVVTAVVIPLGAFAIDIGMQRVARRDAQATADTVALDAGRALVACAKAVNGVIPSQSSIDACVSDAAAKSVALDAGSLGKDQQIAVKAGYVGASTTWISNQALGCGGSASNTYFTYPTPSGQTANAVLVTVSSNVDFGLARSMGFSQGGVCRSAIGSAYRNACMTMDSYAAQLKSGNSAVLGPLLKILGTNIDTTVLSSSGLLTSNIDVLKFLGVLQTQLGVGSTDQVLVTQVTAAQVIAAEATALSNSDGTLSAAASALNSQIGAAISSTQKFSVGDLLGITQGDGSALGATFNAFDVAAGAVQLANGTTPLALSLSSSNLAGLGASVVVGSRPTRVCLGQGTKTMGQTTANISADLNGGLTGAVTNLANGLSGLLSGVLGGLGGVFGLDTYAAPQITFPAPVTAAVSLAQASGKVTALNCAGATPQSITAWEQSSLVPATITVPLTVTVKHTWGFLGSSSENLITKLLITISTQPSPAQSQTGTLNVPGDYETGVAGPSGNLSVNSLQVSSIVISGNDAVDTHGKALVGDLLGGLSSVINALNNSLITPLENAVVSPLLSAVTSALNSLLGVNIAGSTYTPLRTPSCGSPVLRN